MSVLAQARRIHFIGIGGIGMSGIAELLVNLGYEVSGSDMQRTEITDRLASLGARISHGHDARHVNDAEVVVYSSAVRPVNPEMTAARERGLALVPRAELLAELRRLTNLAPDARVRLATPLNAPAALATDLDAQIAAAKASRPERAAFVDRLEAAAARIAAAGASARPSVAVAGGVDYGRPNARIFPRSDRWQDSWDVSVNASWSLWDGGRRGAETGEAVAAERALRARLEEFDSLVALEVRQRRLDLEAGIAAAGAAAHGVRSAAEARRVVDERFAAGVATSTDMLDAQVALLQAELDRTRALAAARIAEARLARAVGVKPGP